MTTAVSHYRLTILYTTPHHTTMFRHTDSDQLRRSYASRDTRTKKSMTVYAVLNVLMISMYLSVFYTTFEDMHVIAKTCKPIMAKWIFAALVSPISFTLLFLIASIIILLQNNYTKNILLKMMLAIITSTVIWELVDVIFFKNVCGNVDHVELIPPFIVSFMIQIVNFGIVVNAYQNRVL